jgi:hypothetical protein
MESEAKPMSPQSGSHVAALSHCGSCGAPCSGVLKSSIFNKLYFPVFSIA